jgi:AraC family transcriptional regulator of arabinose operon
MFVSRDVTHIPVVAPIVTGSFEEAPTYSTWRPHGTQDHLLILTVGGAGRFGFGSGHLIASPGDVVVLRPGATHDYRTARGAPGWALLWTHFLARPHWLEWLAALPEAAPGLYHLALGADSADRAAVEDSLNTMHRYAIGGLARRTEFAMNALETALLLCDAANPHTAARGTLDDRILKAMELLRGPWLAHAVSLPELAHEVGFSPSRLSHLFKAQTGRTPGQFQEEERIVRARQLLTLTNRSITAIAEEVGFASPFYFTLRFKKRMGQSPRDFRHSISQVDRSQNRSRVTSTSG